MSIRIYKGFDAYRRSIADVYCSFFNDTATTEIYTLSLHDALPIWTARIPAPGRFRSSGPCRYTLPGTRRGSDRKSTRLNSSHVETSYAVFCLKKKIKNTPSLGPRYL